MIGVLFSLHNVLRNLGNRGNVVPGYVTLLVAKLIVPTSAALSMLPPLRRRQRLRHRLVSPALRDSR